MLDHRQYLLMKLAEECAEVAQRACKQMQYGRDEIQEGQELTNGQRLRNEINDLTSMVKMLENICEIEPISFLEAQAIYVARLQRVMKYKELSQSLGKTEIL